jgi:molecular chaperone DnaK (HSP70)
MTARLLVGIDLGTTNTVVAWADPRAGGAPEVFAVPQLVTGGEIEARPLLPSMLYAPLAGEVAADPWGDAPWAVGRFARRRGGEVPGRLVASAKSWLCHAGVDRTAPILPWGAPEDAADLPRVSPVEASARVLGHVRRAWDAAFPERPLAAQDVVLTVPASFDEVARELTVEAAARAGLAVRLLEEPQAAFYDYMGRVPGGLEALLEGAPDALVLVADVGGGTTDLSLIRVRRGEAGAPLSVERVAVGHHLLLGGDNMDLALAHLCEPRLVPDGSRLDAMRFGQLVHACRAAKERLLGDAPPDEVPITVLGPGARLVGSALTTSLGRDEAERAVLDGFLPATPRDARPLRAKTALVAFGLPYERDVAITRHVAWFFARHAPAEAGPRALLLNGGVFRAARIAERLASAIQAWGGPPLAVLPHADPDLAVARGAVAYGLALAGRGLRIEGGAARGFYVGLDAPASGGARSAICVVPRGAKEGVRHAAAGRTFALTVGRPVRFDLFASDEVEHAPGDVATLDDDAFEALPPVAATLGGARRGEVRVRLEGELTAIGTLDLACVEAEPADPGREPRRYRLAFQLRGPAPSEGEAPAERRAPAASIGGRRLQGAIEAIERVYGKGRADVDAREAKNLVRELERTLGERGGWTLEAARALFDALAPNAKARRRSADHERTFWQLAGYCLRPGFGDPLDAERAAGLARLFAERLAFPDEARGWQQFWIAWRRAAGGLDEAAQTAIRDVTDPLLAPAEKRLKKPKGWRLEAVGDLLDLASSLERVAPPRKAELGGFVLERTWTDRDPRLWAALGRLGARVPAYSSVHHVVGASVAERWLDHLLREKWADLPSAPEAAVRLARCTGDRARDVSERMRREVERRLVQAGAREAWVRAVRELVEVEESDRTAFFGEALPVGLRLLE